VKKVLVGVGLSVMATMGLSAGAWAEPNPNPNAPDHTGTACTSVDHNPNVFPGGHISATGFEHFAAVGAAMCGLEI
jgi:hypothetical protein